MLRKLCEWLISFNLPFQLLLNQRDKKKSHQWRVYFDCPWGLRKIIKWWYYLLGAHRWFFFFPEELSAWCLDSVKLPWYLSFCLILLSQMCLINNKRLVYIWTWKFLLWLSLRFSQFFDSQLNIPFLSYCCGKKNC